MRNQLLVSLLAIPSVIAPPPPPSNQPISLEQQSPKELRIPSAFKSEADWFRDTFCVRCMAQFKVPKGFLETFSPQLTHSKICSRQLQGPLRKHLEKWFESFIRLSRFLFHNRGSLLSNLLRYGSDLKCKPDHKNGPKTGGAAASPNELITQAWLQQAEQEFKEIEKEVYDDKDDPFMTMPPLERDGFNDKFDNNGDSSRASKDSDNCLIPIVPSGSSGKGGGGGGGGKKKEEVPLAKPKNSIVSTNSQLPNRTPVGVGSRSNDKPTFGYRNKATGQFVPSAEQIRGMVGAGGVGGAASILWNLLQRLPAKMAPGLAGGG